MDFQQCGTQSKRQREGILPDEAELQGAFADTLQETDASCDGAKKIRDSFEIIAQNLPKFADEFLEMKTQVKHMAFCIQALEEWKGNMERETKKYQRMVQLYRVIRKREARTLAQMKAQIEKLQAKEKSVTETLGEGYHAQSEFFLSYSRYLENHPEFCTDPAMNLLSRQNYGFTDFVAFCSREETLKELYKQFFFSLRDQQMPEHYLAMADQMLDFCVNQCRRITQKPYCRQVCQDGKLFDRTLHRSLPGSSGNRIRVVLRGIGMEDRSYVDDIFRTYVRLEE